MFHWLRRVFRWLGRYLRYYRHDEYLTKVIQRRDWRLKRPEDQ